MTIKNMKSQATKRGQVFAKYISNKRLISRICKEFLQINEKKKQPKKQKTKTQQQSDN